MYDVCNGTGTSLSASFTLTAGSGPAGSPRGAASGDLVVVCAGSNAGGAQVISSVTDSKANTYAQQVFDGSTTNQAGIWTSLIGSALVAGTDTITVTWSSTAGSKAVVVKGAGGVASAAADQVNHASGTSTSPDSGSSGVLAQASELVVGVICSASAGGQPAGLSSGGAGTTAHTAGTNYLTEFSQTVSSTVALDMSGTLPVSANWCALVATFKLAGSGLAITSTSPPAGTVGTAYNGGAGYTLTAGGGTAPYTWSVPSGNMPPGISLAPGTAGGHNCGVTITGTNSTTTMDGYYTQWQTSAASGGLGLYPPVAKKVYFTPKGTFPTQPSAAAWKAANAHIGQALDQGTAMYVCFKSQAIGTTDDPAWPGGAILPSSAQITSDYNGMKATLNSLIAAGGKVAGVIMYQECDGAKTYNPVLPNTKDIQSPYQLTYLYFKNYASFKNDFPTMDVVVCYTGYTTDPVLRAQFFPGPSPLQPGGWGHDAAGNTLFCDGIGIDLYGQGFDSGTQNSRRRYYYSETPKTTPGYADIADYNNIAWGNTETGNSASGGAPTQLTIQNYLVGSNASGGTSNPVPLPGDTQLHSLLAVYQARVANGLPSIPMMWYEDFSGTGPDHITASDDYRIPWLNMIDAAAAQATTGLLNGTPSNDTSVTYPHSYSFTLKVKDASGSAATAAESVTISAGTPALTVTTAAGALAGGQNGTVYPGVTLAASGGTGTGKVWTINTGTLSGSGLTLNSNGTITGTGGTAATYTFTARVTDSGAHTAISGTFTITIAAAGTLVTITTTSPLPSGTTGVAYATPDLAAIGGTGPYTWSLATGSDPLPPGLVIDNADPVDDEAGSPVTDEAPGGDLS